MKRPGQRHHPDLERWLEAEAADRRDAAEAALAKLFAALPAFAPSVGFADRVMLAAGLARPLARPAGLAMPRPVRWALRGLLAAAVALVALGAPTLPLLVISLWERFSLAKLVDAAIAALVAGCRWLATTLTFWDELARLGGWVAHTVAVPRVAALLLVGLIAAATALRLLADLIANERSWSHVQST